MALAIVIGPPFSGKSWWIDSEIERREDDGEIGLLHISYSGLYASLIPGAQSTYRDGRITDSGVARYAGYVLRLAVGEAARRQLNGYAAYDSPRLAVQALAEIPDTRVVEVTVTRDEAIRRSQRHIDLVSTLAPRAAQEDGKAAEAKCRKMVSAYFDEQDVLPPDRQRVTAPEAPSDKRDPLHVDGGDSSGETRRRRTP